MIHQLNIALFLIVSTIAVFETIYWTIISANRIIDFIFKPKKNEQS